MTEDNVRSGYLHAELQHAQLWSKIHRQARTDPELKEQLDKIVFYYRLKYER